MNINNITNINDTIIRRKIIKPYMYPFDSVFFMLLTLNLLQYFLNIMDLVLFQNLLL